MPAYYLKVDAPADAVNEVLRESGVRTEARQDGAGASEVHYWTEPWRAREVAGFLAASGHVARVEACD